LFFKHTVRSGDEVGSKGLKQPPDLVVWIFAAADCQRRSKIPQKRRLKIPQ